MRSSNEIFSLITEIASADNRVRAVLLNGSRANPNARKDSFQDFDIVFIVTGMQSFLIDHSWIDVFGERIILQMPDAMTIGNEEERDKISFGYLMLFKDGNRIDLTLFPLDKLATDFKKDSLTKVLLDKDGLFSSIPEPGIADYLIKQPTQKEFTDCCNEFWWVSIYVAKGLRRNEITYAKEMLEMYVRPMFMQMIQWYIGFENQFSVPFGKAGRHMKNYISPDLYNQILTTYPDAQEETIWNSLFIMSGIFKKLAAIVVTKSAFLYNYEEEENVLSYLKKVRES